MIEAFVLDLKCSSQGKRHLTGDLSQPLYRFQFLSYLLVSSHRVEWGYDVSQHNEPINFHGYVIEPPSEDTAFRLSARHRNFGWDMMCPNNWGLVLFRAYVRGWRSTVSQQPEWSGYSHRVHAIQG